MSTVSGLLLHLGIVQSVDLGGGCTVRIPSMLGGQAVSVTVINGYPPPVGSEALIASTSDLSRFMLVNQGSSGPPYPGGGLALYPGNWTFPNGEWS